MSSAPVCHNILVVVKETFSELELPYKQVGMCAVVEQERSSGHVKLLHVVSAHLCWVVLVLLFRLVVVQQTISELEPFKQAPEYVAACCCAWQQRSGRWFEVLPAGCWC
jgi:hypothetical protein